MDIICRECCKWNLRALREFSQSRANVYCDTSKNIADSFVAVTRLANKTKFANAKLFSKSLQQTRNNVGEFSEFGVIAAELFIRL
jgi:hypothetical protein